MENQEDLSFYTKENENGELVLTRVHAKSPQKVIIIPRLIKHIDENAFIFMSHFEEAILPEGIKTIGEKAFYRNLEKDPFTKINLPDSLIEIKERAFEYCNGLKNIKLPMNLKFLGDKTFKDCTSIRQITIPSTLISYQSAFENCFNLKSVIIEEGVNEISSRAFYDCKELEKITLPQGLKYINQSAFKGCESLKEIVIPESVKIIEERAFYGCKNLEKINIPKGIERIGNKAFYNCDKLIFSEETKQLISAKSVTGQKNIELVEDYYYFNLVNSYYVASMKKWSVSYGKIIIPQGITEIGNNAFSDLKVKEFILPDGLKAIKKGAFKNCKQLRKIYIPKSVEIIEDDVFCGCLKLEIYCEKEPTQGWLNKEETRKEYYEDMTDAFNFHRSSGSFDDHYSVKKEIITHNNFNPDHRPVHLNVTFEEYNKINY